MVALAGPVAARATSTSVVLERVVDARRGRPVEPHAQHRDDVLQRPVPGQRAGRDHERRLRRGRAPEPAVPVGASAPLRQPDLPRGEYYAVKITDTTPASPSPASLRFAYSRTNGDITDAAAAAAGKGLAIVFANDQGVPAASGPTSIVAGIGQNYVNLINAVAAANPNTIVVLQSAYADTVSTWLPNVKAMLEGWNSGQEGERRARPPAARPGQPERPHGDDVAGRPERRRSGATTRRTRSIRATRSARTRSG